MSERRKLGENDPSRYVIEVLIGPCTIVEATALMEDVDDTVHGVLGAVTSLKTYDETQSA